MADKKNFNLTGIGANVQYGKGGGRIRFATDHLEARNAADSGFIDVYVPLTPGNDQAAASKSYVDEFTTTLIDAKNSVRVATTGDGPFTTAYDAGSSVDAVVLVAGDRILIKDQSDGTENGIYIVQGSGAPVRTNDANTDAEMTQGAFTFIVLGTQNALKTFIVTTPDPITLGSTATTWEEAAGGGGSGSTTFTGLTDTPGSFSGESGTRITVNNAESALVFEGTQFKDPVVVATTTNGTLATAYENGDTIDDITLVTGDRILLKNQSAGAENGIYTVESTGAPTRTDDFDDDKDAVLGCMVAVNEGTAGAQTLWQLANITAVTIGSTSQTWTQISGGGGGGNSFGIVTGDSGTATADIETDTLQMQGATNGGITTTGSDAPELITFGLTPVDLSTTVATIALGDFMIVSDSADTATTVAQKVTWTSIISDLGILTSETNAFGVVTGDTGTATSDTTNDTLQLQGATSGGITTVGTDAPELVTFSLTPVDLATTSATIVGADFLIVSDSGDSATTLAQKITFTAALNDLGVPFTGGTLDINILDIKLSVRVATTANISLTGEQTIDDIATSTDRILVKNQSAGAENGIYVTAAGAWSRATDSDADVEVTQGNVVFVTEGTVNEKTSFILVTVDPITVGSTAQVWESAGGGGGGGATVIDDLTDVDTTTVPPGAGQTLGWDGTNWIPASANALEVGQFDLLHVQDQKADTTQGGTFTSGAWRTRDLTVEVTNEITGASLASNQITLLAGTYEVEASAPGFRVNNHKTKLRDTTNSIDLIMGTSEYSDSGATAPGTRSFVRGRFTLTGTAVLELQHYSQLTQADTGFGIQTSIVDGSIEVYADIRIRRITPVQTVAGLPFKGALIKLAADETTANYSTAKAIPFDTVEYDTDQIFNGSTVGRLTVPTGVTKVTLTGQIFSTLLTVAEHNLLDIRKNGAVDWIGYAAIRTAPSEVSGFINVSTPIVEVIPGDFFELFYTTQADTSITVDAGRSSFAIEAVESTAPSAKSRGALVTLAADQLTVDFNPAAAASFDKEVYDTDNIHDNVTNNTRLTVPSGVSRVRLSTNVHVLITTPSEFFILTIRKNGAIAFDGAAQQMVEVGSTENRNSCATPVIEVVAGDYFEVWVRMEADSSVTVDADETWFAMEIIEPAVIVGDLFFDSTIQTTDATKVNIARGLLAAGEVATVWGEGQAIETATGDVYWFTISGAVKNISGTTSLIGTAKITEDSDTGAASWTVGLEADDTADAWELTVTGQTAKTIEWKISSKEVKQ